MTEYNVIKVALLGAANTGKSSLSGVLTNERYEHEYIPTIGADIKYRYIEPDKFKIHIWDLAGDPRYNNITESYFRDVHLVALCYDSTDFKTYMDLTKRFNELQARKILNGKKFVVVALKRDKPRKNADQNWGTDLSHRLNCPFMECSARYNMGVKEIYDYFISLGWKLHSPKFNRNVTQKPEAEKPCYIM